MIIGGFDTASYTTGYFFLDIINIKYKIGILEMKGTPEERVRQLFHKSRNLFKKYEPSIIIIENTYLDEWRKHKNTKKRGNIETLKILNKCQGAVISATDELTDIYYMMPSEHKEAMTGIGNAGKIGSIWSIQKKLGLANVTNDEADAASLVLTYLMKKNQWDILDKIRSKYE